MKINKYGKVVVTEDDIVISDFDIDFEGENTMRIGVKIRLSLWAIRRLLDAIDIEIGNK